MKKITKVLAAGFVLGLMTSLVACKNPSTSSSAPGSSSSAPQSSASSSSSSVSTAPSTSTVEFEEVSYSLNVSDSLEAGTSATDIIAGKFTVVGGTEVRNRTKTFEGVEYTKSVKLGSSSSAIKVSAPGEGTLSFIVQNGSSSAKTQKVKITKPDGSSEEIEFAGTDEGSPLVKLEIPVVEGDYLIQRVSGTVDVYYLEMTCQVEKAEETGFEIVTPGKVNYLLGESFDSSDLALNKVFGNGRTDELPLDQVTIDSSAFNKNVSGTYDIKVKYGNYEELTYKVNVYSVDSLKLDFDAIEKLSNTSAGNGVYYNHSVQEVYGIGDTFDTTGLNVTVVGKLGETTKEFLLDSEVEYSGFDSSTAGTKTITVTYNYGENLKHTETFDVHVVATAPSKVNDVYQVQVDDDYKGEIGAVVNNYNTFSTVQQALDYLESRDEITGNDQKLIYINDGLYEEKLEIEIPNLTIKGAGKDDVTIEWDSLYGVYDGGGFSHTTDSTQTVAVRESAINCRIEGLTISNWYNSQARFDERGKGIERALALLVQSDQFIMKDSKLLGVQDTLELFTGRQYFENVFISGYTDFIFGTNNTTYFKNCTVHTIDTSKDNSGTAGYLTAFKGSNKGESDYIKYGAIFDGCKFSADEGVMEGKTAIGRTWGAYAAVAVINSELGAHISKDAYDKGENKNKRYISMNGIHPTDDTVQFVEYNNTGAGAISEAVAGMKMLTEEEAKNYSDFAVIYGTTNGKVSYVNAWDPLSNEVQKDENIYYYFNGKDSETGTSHTYDQNLNGTTGEFGDIVIDATAGKVTARDSDTQINAGAKLTFDVKAGSLVMITNHSGYAKYTLNGVETTSDNFQMYFAEDTTVVFEAYSTVYLHSIIIKPNQEAPEAPTLENIEVEGGKTSFEVGEEFSYADLVVKAEYSDFSLLPVTDYTVELVGDINVAGEYEVVVTYQGKTSTYKVTYVAAGVDPTLVTKSMVIDTTECKDAYEKTTGQWGYLNIDATAGKFANNGSWVQFNEGTIITIKVAEGAEVEVSTYQNAEICDVYVADGIATIEATANGYIRYITITIPYIFTETTTVDLTKCEATYQGNSGEYEGIAIDATTGKFQYNSGNGWVQVNETTTLTLSVLEGAKVTINAYTANKFTISEIVDGKVTITAIGNDYLKSVTVSYPVIYSNTTIDLSATGGIKIEGTTGIYEGLEIDATSGKFADNNGGWVQVNKGTIIKLKVAENAKVSVTANSSADNFTIEVVDGVATITATGNDYLKAIIVA